MNSSSHERFYAPPDTGRGLHPDVDDTFAFREVIESPLLVRRQRAAPGTAGGGRRVLAGIGHPPAPELTREDFVVAVAARVAGSRTL